MKAFPPVSLPLVPFIFGMGLLLGGCGKPVEHSKYIPKEASVVFCFNLPSIQEKAIQWELLLNRDVVQLFANFNQFHNLGPSLKEASIDTQYPVYFFREEGKTRADRYVALSFRIKDESKFDAFLRKIPTQKLSIRSFAGIRYTILDNKTILGWMNRAALLIAKETKTSEEELKNYVLRLRDLPERESLKFHNEQFRQLRQSSYDVAAWFSLHPYEAAIKKSLGNVPLPINLDLEDNFLTVRGTFLAGKTELEASFFNLNGSLREYRNLVKDSINPALLTQLPHPSLLGGLGLGLNIKGLKDLFNRLGAKLLARQAEDWIGSTPDDLLDMLSGDLLALLENIRVGRDPREIEYALLLGLGIRQEVTLQKILQKFEQNGLLVRQDSIWQAPSLRLSLAYRPPVFFISTVDSLLRLPAGAPSVAKAEVVRRSQRSFVVGYADVREQTRQKIPSLLFQGDRYIEGWTKYTQTPLESLIFSITPVRNKVSTLKLSLFFKNREVNALQSLVDALKQPPTLQAAP
ncbi:MAG: DUF4836 family protein [Microscillaceae bacterium]|nr:DUF4836 family protein [Microscillaceae bacterium]